MFEREPNIDIVFRNGLREMEVLPPSDVWDNIPPMPVIRSHNRLLTVAAAAVAILVSFSLLATWFTRNNNLPGSGDLIAYQGNDDISAPGNNLQVLHKSANTGHSVAAAGTPSELPVTHTGETLIPDEGGIDMPSVMSSVTLPERKADSNGGFGSDNVTVIRSENLQAATGYASGTLLADNGGSSDQRFMIGASLSPALGFSSPGDNTRLAELLGNEKGVPGYSTGVTFGYIISPRLTIQSGIGMASIGQVISGVDVFAGLSDFYSAKGGYLYSVETGAGTILSANPDLYLSDRGNRVGTLIPGGVADPSKYALTPVSSDIHQVFRYIELPVLLRYKLIDRDVDLNLSGGMSYGLLVDNFAYTRNGGDLIPVGHTEGVSMHSLSSQIGLGMEYNLSSKVMFNVEPVFRYYMTPISNISGSLYKPYSFGLFSGFFFKF